MLLSLKTERVTTTNTQWIIASEQPKNAQQPTYIVRKKSGVVLKDNKNSTNVNGKTVIRYCDISDNVKYQVAEACNDVG